MTEDIRTLVEQLRHASARYDEWYMKGPAADAGNVAYDLVSTIRQTLAALLTKPKPKTPPKYRDQLLAAAYDLAHEEHHHRDGCMAFLDVADRIMEEIDAKHEAELAARLAASPEPTSRLIQFLQMFKDDTELVSRKAEDNSPVRGVLVGELLAALAASRVTSAPEPTEAARITDLERELDLLRKSDTSVSPVWTNGTSAPEPTGDANTSDPVDRSPSVPVSKLRELIEAWQDDPSIPALAMGDVMALCDAAERAQEQP